MGARIRAAIVAMAAIGGRGSAQSTLPPEVIELARIKAHVREDLAKLPNYTCVETIDRSTRENGKMRASDRLRVEVIHADNRELYAWPGARRLDARISEVVRNGVISDGEFAEHVRSIFLNNAAQTSFAGEATVRGRAALEYDYRIAQPFSGWTLNYAQASAAVAAAGSFWVDRQTHDLLRIEYHAENIPDTVPYRSVVTSIEYARVAAAGSALMPETADLRVTLTDRSENENHIEFSQCRGYGAQSSLVADGAAAESAPAALPGQEIELPGNLTLTLALDGAIDSSTAVEGDAIRAVVKADVKSGNRVVVPKGAIATGRIRRLERYSEPRPHFIVGLEFSEIATDAGRASFQARLVEIEPLPSLNWYLTTKHATMTRDQMGTEQHMEGETLHAADLPGVGTFFADEAHFRLPQGFSMVWRTMEAKPPR